MFVRNPEKHFDRQYFVEQSVFSRRALDHQENISLSRVHKPLAEAMSFYGIQMEVTEVRAFLLTNVRFFRCDETLLLRRPFFEV